MKETVTSERKVSTMAPASATEHASAAPQDPHAPQPKPRGPLTFIKRIFLAIGTTLCSINIWTGAPLLAVWAGSRVVPDSGLSMGAVFLVLLVLCVSVGILGFALTWMNARYDALTGRPHAARRQSPWMRSMRGEREEFERDRHRLSALEMIVVLAAVVAVVGFEVWFFFFAGSSLPNA
jgi:hypothetical protein